MSVTSPEAPVTLHPDLGRQARDTLNGFTGVLTCRAEYVTGCVYVLLECCDADGNPAEHWTDEKRVELLPITTKP